MTFLYLRKAILFDEILNICCINQIKALILHSQNKQADIGCKA